MSVIIGILVGFAFAIYILIGVFVHICFTSRGHVVLTWPIFLLFHTIKVLWKNRKRIIEKE
jgi:hypothetical protein